MQKNISFTNSKGDKLVGILTQPNDSLSKPLIIIVHGFLSSKNAPTLVRLSDILVKDELATLRIDLYAHGESDGNIEDITISEACDDVLQAIAYGKSLGYAKIGLIGSSFGGIASTMAATKSQDLLFLGLKSPVSDYEEVWRMRKTPEEMNKWKRTGSTEYEGHTIRYAFIEDLKDNYPYSVASSIEIPTLIVHGDQDDTVPLSQSEKLAKIITHSRLHIVTHANHRYEGEGEKEQFFQAMREFVLKHV